MAKAFLALGSNLGDRAALLRAALAQIAALPFSQLVATSDFITTPAEDSPPEAPDFLNAVAEIETQLEPQALMAHLLAVEQSLGRTREGPRHAPRTIDLDLLLYDRRVIDTPALTLPHPRMTTRRFVLGPLASIAPEAYHPVAGKTARQLLAELA
jgi:2-amino-4-hydroxy-6-hydroxymethyldihydropteridine diphosphokinase